jgi:glycosidase
MKEDISKTKMALSLMLTLPRIPQILYGTEILMEDSDNPGDHGLIRTDFPGGWENDKSNAFTGENLEESQLEMQNYLKTLLNFRKNSKAIHKGRTLHYAPKNGVYLISRKFEDEIVIYIVNKNNKSMNLDTGRFTEIDADGKTFIDIHSKKRHEWKEKIKIEKNSSIILSTKI